MENTAAVLKLLEPDDETGSFSDIVERVHDGRLKPDGLIVSIVAVDRDAQQHEADARAQTPGSAK